MKKVHQILPSLAPGDAIGNEVLLMRDLLRSWGYESDIFAQHIHPDVQARPYKEYELESSPQNLLIYHFSIGSEVSNFIKGLPDRKIMIYHNITPPHFFRGINDNLMFLLDEGRKELGSLSREFDLALADSEYNRIELEGAGYPETGLLPLLIDFSKYQSFNPDIVEKYSDGRVNILFVGRISPNKKHEDIIKTFYYYKCINPKARLLLPGGYDGCELYFQSLRSLVQRLGLSDVYFLEKVPFKDLVSYYMVSDVFLCMSEHEGFNVPLVESMFFDVPIIAYNSSAIPYTLGDAGILVKSKRYVEIAELINLIVGDPDIRGKLVHRQKERFQAFKYDTIVKQFYSIIKGFERND
ncbi:glycosyltransferase [Methanoculleus sp.]|uniref:glycosyltransferase family 4 protein n=1 Tax=Methanoculleus sp. TaxID=90427 RepID=UPI00262036EA|nr:glycosyltransferase [Methanoculleus sp.]MDI6867884.1 glycosyltransferase [Methanoculleus sp.]